MDRLIVSSVFNLMQTHGFPFLLHQTATGNEQAGDWYPTGLSSTDFRGLYGYKVRTGRTRC